MADDVYYEDVRMSSEIGPLIKHPTTRQLVMWAGAAQDYNPIHYDKDFAQTKGLASVIVQGQLIACFLGQLMTDWVGKQGRLRKLTCSYRGMIFPGEDIICKAKVTRKYIEGGVHYVECDIWVENLKGEKPVSGMAKVILPARGSGE